MTFGGFAAEKIVFGDTTTGPSGDIQQATRLARSMVTRYGMSDSIGAVALASEPGVMGFGAKDFSEKIASEIDEEIRRIIEEGKQTAFDVLNEKRNVLDIIAKRLLDVETLERDDYEKILIANGISVKPRGEMNLSEGVPKI
jgi:cell division protease FtsH